MNMTIDVRHITERVIILIKSRVKRIMGRAIILTLHGDCIEEEVN